MLRSPAARAPPASAPHGSSPAACGSSFPSPARHARYRRSPPEWVPAEKDLEAPQTHQVVVTPGGTGALDPGRTHGLQFSYLMSLQRAGPKVIATPRRSHLPGIVRHVRRGLRAAGAWRGAFAHRHLVNFGAVEHYGVKAEGSAAGVGASVLAELIHRVLSALGQHPLFAHVARRVSHDVVGKGEYGKCRS